MHHPSSPPTYAESAIHAAHSSRSGHVMRGVINRGAMGVLACCLISLLLENSVCGATVRIDSRNDGQYAISVWRDEQGLPQNTIRSILQSHDGYLWLATFNGLARFNGVKFTVFDTSNTSEFRNNLINRIFEDSGGRLWVGHDTGNIEVYENGVFYSLPLPADWIGQPIDSFAEDASGRVWILNRLGWILPVANLKPEVVLKSFPLADYLIRDEAGQIWARSAAPKGGCIFQTVNASKMEATPILPAKSWAFASRKGGLWVAEKNHLRRWHQGRWQEERPSLPTLDMFHPAFLETQDGRLIAGCFKDGLYILENDGQLTHLTTSNGLANDWVYCLCEDRENGIWAGTGGGGLNMLRPRRVEMLDPPDRWQGKAVMSVASDNTGNLWMGTEGAGIYRWQEAQVRPIPQNNVFPSSVFWSVLYTTNQVIWLGSWGNGLFILTNDVAKPVPLALAPGISKDVVCLYADRSGKVWVGTDSGMGYFEAGKWITIEAGPGLARPDVRCITETSDGSIWIGTMGTGLCRLQNGQITRFSTTNGLASDYVWALWEAPDKALWVGTFGGGLSRLSNGKFKTLTKKNGLPSDVICNIQDDQQGNLWMSSFAGIFRVATRELNDCAGGVISEVNCLLYDSSDGLSTREMSGGCQPSGCRMEDGRLAFATRSGLAIVNPAKAIANQLPPQVIIEEFLVDGKSVPVHQNHITPATISTNEHSAGDTIVLTPGERRIELHYTGLSFAAPQRVHFRYQMVGLDRNWIDAGTKRSVDYSYLPPGDYQFRVTACNNDGVWNKEGAKLAFTVLPYFWQTWWFSASCWVTGSGLVAGFALSVARRRNRRKLEIVERQRALERERTRIAQDIHDELGASLTRIMMFSQSAQAKTKTGRNPEHEVSTIFSTARDITRSMDEIVWAINPKHDTLGSLMAYLANFIEEFLAPTGINYELNFPPAHTDWPITAEARHDLFLALKEALNNIVKHAAAGKVVVSLETRDEQFVLQISDNGCGFDQHALEKQTAKSGRFARGNGLENMQKRLREIGGTCQVTSVPGRGTQICFRVPLHDKTP